MAAPSKVASTSYADTSNSTSRTLAYPSGGSSGDWFLLRVGIDNSARVVNTPTGFTLVSAILEPGTAHALYIFKRKKDGTEGSNVTITSDSEYTTGIMTLYTGCDSTDCIDVLSIGAGELGKGPNARCPNAYAISADSLIERVVCSDGGIVSLSTPSGHTLDTYQAGGTSGTSLMVATKTQASAGYTDSAYSTSGAVTEEYIGVTIVLRSTATPAALPSEPVIRCLNYVMPPTTAPDAYFKKPYGTVQDDLLVMLRESDVGAFSTFTGATNIQNGSNTAIYARADFLKAGPSEPDTYGGFTTTAGAHVGILARVINYDTTDPIDTSSINTGTDAAPTGSSITVANTSALGVYMAGCDDDDATYDTGYPSGWTGMIAVANQEAADSSFICAIKALSSGSSGSVAGSIGATEEWVAILFAINPVPAATDVTITGGAGSYAVTGGAASLEFGSEVIAGVGSYSVSGQASSLEFGAEVSAAAGSYPVTGQAASLEIAALASAEAGNYTVSGTDTSLSYEIPISAEAGSYGYSGQAAGLEYGAEVIAGAGSYSVAGQPTSLEYLAEVNADAGSYAVSGQAAGLAYSTPIAAEAGAYSVTGQAASVEYGAEVAAGAGAYAVTGQAASLEAALVLGAGAGSYAVSGQDAGLVTGGEISAGVGSYVIAGQSAVLPLAAEIGAGPGSYAVNGSDAGLESGWLVSAGAGSYAYTGQDSILIADGLISVQAGAYVYSGADAGLATDSPLSAEMGEYLISGQDVDLGYTPILSGDPARSFPFVANVATLLMRS